jgi:hypothetical protein
MTFVSGLSELIHHFKNVNKSFEYELFYVPTRKEK